MALRSPSVVCACSPKRTRSLVFERGSLASTKEEAVYSQHLRRGGCAMALMLSRKNHSAPGSTPCFITSCNVKCPEGKNQRNLSSTKRRLGSFNIRFSNGRLRFCREVPVVGKNCTVVPSISRLSDPRNKSCHKS